MIKNSLFTKRKLLVGVSVAAGLLQFILCCIGLGHKNIQHSVRYTAQNPKRFEHFNWDWDGKSPF